MLKQGLFYLLTFTVCEYVSMGDPRGIALLDRAHRGQMFFDVNLVTIHVKGHF